METTMRSRRSLGLLLTTLLALVVQVRRACAAGGRYRFEALGTRFIANRRYSPVNATASRPPFDGDLDD